MIKIPAAIRLYFANNKPAIISISISIFLLTIYWIHSPKVIVKDFFDAQDYIDYAYSYGISWKRFFNDYRAPIYPLILYIIGFTNPMLDTTILYITQVIIFLANIILSWEVLKRITENHKIKIACILLISVGLDIFWMTKTALSEILTMFFLLLSFLFYIKMQAKFSYVISFLFSTSFVLLSLTRPFNTYLFLPLIIFWIIKNIFLYKKVKLVNYLITGILIILPLYTYAYTNKIRHKYFGISIEGGANLLAQVAQYHDYLPEKDEKYQETLDWAKKCRINKEDYFTCQIKLIPPVYPNTPGSITGGRDDSYIHEVEGFSKKYLIKLLALHTRNSIEPSVKSLTELYIKEGNDSFGNKYDYWYGIRKDYPFSFIFRFLSSYLQGLHYFFAANILFIAPIYWIYLFIKKEIKKHINLLAAYFIILYYISVTGFIAAGDFGRMVIPALPLIYITSTVIFLNVLIKIYHKYKL